MSNDRKVLIFIILLGLGLWAVASRSYRQVDDQRREAIADLQEAQLVPAGWILVPEQTSSDVSLPALQDEIQVADEVGTDIALVVNANSEEVVVQLPLPPDASLPATQPSSEAESQEVVVGNTGSSDTPSAKKRNTPLHIKPSLQLRVDLDELHRLFYTGKILVHMEAPKLGFTSDTSHRLEGANIALGEKLKTALEYYQMRPKRIDFVRRPRHWRMGLSAGPALMYSPSGVNVGIAVLWGAQF